VKRTGFKAQRKQRALFIMKNMGQRAPQECFLILFDQQYSRRYVSNIRVCVLWPHFRPLSFFKWL